MRGHDAIDVRERVDDACELENNARVVMRWIMDGKEGWRSRDTRTWIRVSSGSEAARHVDLDVSLVHRVPSPEKHGEGGLRDRTHASSLACACR